jgi:hypothetical protein
LAGTHVFYAGLEVLVCSYKITTVRFLNGYKTPAIIPLAPFLVFMEVTMRTFTIFCLLALVSPALGDAREPAEKMPVYSWQIVPGYTNQVALYNGDQQIGAYRFTDKTYFARGADGWFKQEKCPTAQPAKPVTESEDALDEVNAKRSSLGLKPYIKDPKLALAAVNCARYRAANLIRGHTDDFAFLPAGSNCNTAGCGALTPDWGWQSCCDDESQWTYAGAAWVMGSDGRRYMHLFVR